MSEPTKKLTKKEKKAQAFRQQKGKKPSISATPFTDEDAVPISEDINQPEDEREPPVVADKEKGKKRKRTEIDEGEEDKVEGQGEEEVPKKKKRQRGKKKSQQVRPGVDEEGKPRLIVFVGNLPYKITSEEIAKHFEPCGELPTVRLLTPKPDPSKPNPPSSKGCAFLQFSTSTSLQSALRLHHSTLQNRKINVELTAGGGGNSEARKTKIVAQREKLTLEREKALKNKRLREGEGEDGDKTGRWKMAAGAKKSQEDIVEDDGAVVVDGRKKKVRDRRNREDKAGEGKKKMEKEMKEAAERKALKASSGANAIKLASGWGNKA